LSVLKWMKIFIQGISGVGEVRWCRAQPDTDKFEFGIAFPDLMHAGNEGAFEDVVRYAIHAELRPGIGEKEDSEGGEFIWNFWG
jgi:hypothetical protein